VQRRIAMPACLRPLEGAPPLDERELKFLPDAAAARLVWAIAAQHLRPQSARGPFTYSRTTYFDTADLAYLRSPGHRLRVREYSTPTGIDAPPIAEPGCYLELKRSAEGRRAKTRLALRPDQLAAALAAAHPTPLTPWVTTWYRRQALVDGAGRLRLTLDDRLLLCRPRPFGAPFDELTDADEIAPGPAFVLEYKAWAAPPPWLTRALADLPEATGFSKFVLGMRALGQPSTRAAAHA